MRIAYLDCFSGISGDMFLGALVDAGLPFELFEQTVASLGVGATLDRSRVDRNGISATKVDVLVNGKKDLPREEFWEQQAEGSEPQTERSHGHGRHLSAILKIIDEAQLSDTAKSTARAVFNALGQAEARVHNVPVEKVHFHEVGAADAIVDIVCAAVGAEALQVGQIVVSALNVGGGTIRCDHGVLPVPAPATLELLKGVPTYSGEVLKELVTPTGAAIVKTLASRFGPRPAMIPRSVGYGAGARNFAGHSNVLRLVVGETADEMLGAASGAGEEEIAVLEVNLDDLSPQLVAYAVEKLLASGALDVFAVPAQMKKGRSGVLLSVLARPQDEAALRDILFMETSTLGVRARRERRRILERRHEAVATPWGEVRIKIGSLGGTDTNVAPEYEDCRRIATGQNVPLKTVMQEALRLYWEKKNG